MNLYPYHPDTKKYLGFPILSEESPLEKGTYHILANTTPKEPPITSANEAAIFSEELSGWNVTPDFIGQTFYDQAGNAVVIEAPGAIPANLSATKPAPTQAQIAAMLTANKASAIAAVDQYHAETVQQLAGNPTQVEKDTWAMKLATANAVLSGVTVSAEGNAFMTAAGFTTPSDQSAWASKVRDHAAKFAGIVGLADSLRSQAKAAITAAADQVALDAAIADSKAAALAAIAALKV